MPRIQLPEPAVRGKMSIEEAIASRRSRRSYAKTPLSVEQVGQLLWSAQGITGDHGRRRAAPSAGACYPLHVLVVIGAGGVEEVDAGLFRYDSAEHALDKVREGDIRQGVARACLGQDFIESAPVNLVLAAEPARAARRYGERAERYGHLEAGHIAENVHLQVESLGLATVVVGAFRDEDLAETLCLAQDVIPLYVMPIGYAS